MKNALLGLLALHLAALPCLADVVPMKYDQKSAADRQAVQSRLESLGAGADAAQESVKRLAPEELAFFASDTERVQAAGGLYWYEFLGGLAFAGVLAWITVLVIREAND